MSDDENNNENSTTATTTTTTKQSLKLLLIRFNERCYIPQEKQATKQALIDYLYQQPSVHEEIQDLLEVESVHLNHAWVAMANNESVDLMEALLNQGMDGNVRGRRSTTALIEACSNGQEEVVRLLMQFRIPPSQDEEDENNEYVSENVNEDESTEKERKTKPTPKYQHRQFTLRLNAMDSTGETALFKACRNGHESCVRLLIENGANVCEMTSSGHYNYYYAYEPCPGALGAAARSGHESIVLLLLEYGADPHFCVRGKNAIDVAMNDTIRDILTNFNADSFLLK